MTWLDATHPEYKPDQWQTVRAHLEGKVLEDLETRLIRKGQGEADEAYRLRERIASYIPHYTRAVLALAGMIIQNEDDMQRTWFEGTLGSPQDDGSVMAQLWRDVDGRGTDWNVLRTQSLVDMVGYQRVWTLVEGVRRDNFTRAGARDNGRIRLINPLNVMDWVRDDTGRLIEVKVQSSVDPRSSVEEKPQTRDQWHVYDLQGFRRFIKQDGTPMQVGDKQPYGPNDFQYEGRSGRPVLPIYETVVPVRAPIGYMMARFAEWLFNFRNVRNFHLFSSALARSFTDATDDNGRLDEDMFQEFEGLLQQGSSFFPQEIGYAAPPMEGAKTRNDTLEDETDKFYSVFFQSFGDVARERTATEINQQVAQSVGAYLTLQTQALDEWENDALWRIAQVNAPDEGPETWRQGSVERSTDFSHIDVEGQIRSLAENAFDGQVPLGQTGRVNAAMKYADRLDIRVDEQEVQDEVTQAQPVGSLLQRIRQQGEQDGVEL